MPAHSYSKTISSHEAQVGRPAEPAGPASDLVFRFIPLASEGSRAIGFSLKFLSTQICDF